METILFYWKVLSSNILDFTLSFFIFFLIFNFEKVSFWLFDMTYQNVLILAGLVLNCENENLSENIMQTFIDQCFFWSFDRRKQFLHIFTHRHPCRSNWFGCENRWYLHSFAQNVFYCHQSAVSQLPWSYMIVSLVIMMLWYCCNRVIVSFLSIYFARQHMRKSSDERQKSQYLLNAFWLYFSLKVLSERFEVMKFFAIKFLGFLGDPILFNFFLFFFSWKFWSK